MAALSGRVLGGQGVSDPEFARIPFDKWMEGSDQTQIKWTTHVVPPVLTTFQRLAARLDVRVDGAELVRRRGKGEVLFFVEIKDETGATWQDHGTIELHKVEEGMRSQDVVYSESMYVVPGEYRASIAVYFTDTGEHAVRKEKLRVPALKNDPLPDAWRDMPRVEFRPAVDPPDSWFEPASGGRLNLSAPAKRPIRIDVLVNLTPSEEASGSLRSKDRTMGALIPALKDIAQIDG